MYLDNNQSLRKSIEEALYEARILECAMDNPDEDHILFVTMKLSGAPFFLIKEVLNDL